jgi:hypothetical protein
MIFDNDPLVYGRTSKRDPNHWQTEINGLFGKFGIVEYMWTFDITYDSKLKRWVSPSERVRVVFTVPNTVFKQPISLEVPAPKIWHRPRYGKNFINWRASMSNMFHYLKTSLSNGYIMEMGSEVMMLGHILTPDRRTVVDILSDQLALPNKEPPRRVN